MIDFKKKSEEKKLKSEVEIDEMARYEMAKIWRFGGRDDLLHGDVGKYFRKVFIEKGGFSPEISKSLGWQK
jgi:hypothetical protein